MWSLEIGASRDTVYTTSIQRAHGLRALAFTSLFARIWRSIKSVVFWGVKISDPNRKLRAKPVLMLPPDEDMVAGMATDAANDSTADGKVEPSQLKTPASARYIHSKTEDTSVTVNRDGAIVILALNRPERLNAINYAMVDRLRLLLDDIEQDDTARAVVMTGVGNQAFSAGADIHEFSKSVAAGPAFAVREFVSRGQALTARIERFPKPVVAAINGIAFGGGCEILEAAHLAVAADTATFAKPEIRLDMPPTFGGTQRLPRIAGRKRALEHLLTGDPFDAKRALSLGLVNSVVPPSKLMGTALELARNTTKQSQNAVAAILEAVSRGSDRPIGEALLEERKAFAGLVGKDELSKGLASWRNRPRRKS